MRLLTTVAIVSIFTINLSAEFGFGGMFDSMQGNMNSMRQKTRDISQSAVDESSEVYDKNKIKKYSNQDTDKSVSDDIVKNTVKTIPNDVDSGSSDKSYLKLQNRFGHREY